MAEQILLAAADPGDPVHPGQETRVLERLDRDANAVAAAFGGSGDPFVAREAPSAAIGIVKAPEKHAEHS